jgi:hypothetical protein
LRQIRRHRARKGILRARQRSGQLVKNQAQDVDVRQRAVGQGDMAQSVKSIKLDAGMEGGLDDLRLSPLSVVARVASPEVGKPVDLKITAASAHANLKAETASSKNLAVTGLSLNAKADIEAQLQPGVLASVKACDGTWCRVSGEGFDGFIPQDKLWGVYPNEKVE